MSARDSKKSRTRGRGFLPAQMSWTDSLRIGVSLKKPIAQRHWGGGVGGGGLIWRVRGHPEC